MTVLDFQSCNVKLHLDDENIIFSEEYFIILKGSIPQENFKMINVCVLNRKKSIKIKQNLAMKR